MKVAIIGSGNIANFHAKELLNLGFQIQVVVDSNLKKAETFATEWGIKQATDNEDEAFRTGVDVVHICTPPSTHFQLIKKAIMNGIHVLCEKPLTLNSKESEELLMLSKKRNIKVAVNFNVRYHDALKKMKKHIESEKFGDIRFVKTSYLQEYHILPTTYGWRYDSYASGNMRAISEIGSHIIDILTYLTDEKIVRLSAITKNYVPIRYMKNSIMYEEKVENSKAIEIKNEDTAIISFQLENGAIGNIALSEISHGKTNEISIHIDGSRNSTWWNNENPYQLYIGDNKKGLRLEIDSFGGGYVDTFNSFFEEVYNDIRFDQGEENYPTLKDGHYNTVITEAILKSSMNKGTWIEI